MIEKIDIPKLIWEKEGNLQTNIDSILLNKINEIIVVVNKIQENEKEES